jgi:uncharacterized damage-inducible protein DinB
LSASVATGKLTVVGSLREHFVEMARNNAWANHRLYEACIRLSDAERRAARTSFFPSIHATLSHILIVDWYYVDALEARRRGPALYTDPEPFASFVDLRAAQGEVDRQLLAWCERMTEASADAEVILEREASGQHPERVADVLAHLFQHQIHHRGQVHAMLAGTSVPPPQLDEYFLREDASRRADDLRALGFPRR